MRKVLLLFTSLIFANVTVNAQAVRFVAPNSAGKADGLTAASAIDFLSDTFWADIQNLLQKQPVIVKFVEGDYVKAYTTKTLYLKNMGNAHNRLTLEGNSKTVFTAPAGYATKSLMMSVVDSENITIKDFRFTGDGSINYVFRVSSTETGKTKNILIENCSWEDMKGVVFATVGVQQFNTSYITFKNCTFKRIGKDGGSHMIYNAYGAQHVSIIDSHFEDCMGDYVRFRANLDYGMVRGSKFIRNKEFPAKAKPFISMPNFNKKRTEIFASNYVFIDNEFINNSSNKIENAIAFHHYGFDRPGFNYLLTQEEGEILTKGTVSEKKNLLLKNFGITSDLIRVYNNRFSENIQNKVAIGSFPAFGAESKGWKGFGDIYAVIKNTNQPYKWESELLK